MLSSNIRFYLMALAAVFAISACGKTETTAPVKDEPVVENPAPAATTPAAATPKSAPVVVKIVWSYYTSWSLIAAAEDFGLLNGKEGELGSLEKEENVDVVLQRAEYVDSMNLYAAGAADAVVLTNTDVLGTAEQRKQKINDASVAAMATSHSKGADQIIATNDVKTWADLKGVAVKGAEGSVTQYLFWRACQINGVPYSDYKFENLDPVVGAPQFVGRQEGMKAFGGWSPETFTVLDGRKDVHAVFTSAALESYEITDMFLIGQSAIDRGGAGAIKVVARSLTEMNKRLAGESTKTAALNAFSKRFNNLTPEYLNRALEVTPVASPTKENDILNDENFKKTMPRIQEFATAHKLCAGTVPYAWGTKDQAPTATVRFDTSYLP